MEPAKKINRRREFAWGITGWVVAIIGLLLVIGCGCLADLFTGIGVMSIGWLCFRRANKIAENYDAHAGGSNVPDSDPTT